MSLMAMLQQMQRDGGLEKLAAQFGMDPQTANSLAGMVAPALGTAARKRAEVGGLENVLGKLKGEAQADYFRAPERAAEPQAVESGFDFLDQLLGSREATTNFAAEAGRRAGADPSAAEGFLPALAAALQGGLQQQAPDSTLDSAMSAFSGGGTGGSGGLLGTVMGMLGGGSKSDNPLGSIMSMLDADGDGSPLDDILEQVMKR